MEGVTSSIYRQTIFRFFSPYDRYYTPFLSPTADHRLTNRHLAEIDISHTQDMHLVPQVLTNNCEDFIWFSKELKKMGYNEVNLNLGCPSGTVVKKKKGSGLLATPDILDHFLDTIFSECSINISIKTRIGITNNEEFDQLLAIYNKYPICELIIHPRVQKQLYRGNVSMETFKKSTMLSQVPLCYNGNIFTPNDVENIIQEFPSVNAIMLGRGAIANPGLINYLKTGKWITLTQLREFHDTIYSLYQKSMSGQRPTLYKMRELWAYMSCMFNDVSHSLKQIRKAETFSSYEIAVDEMFRTCTFLPDGSFLP